MADAAQTLRSERPLKILITEGSSISARQSIFDLGPKHQIDILDSSRLCQCRFSNYVRRWHRCPPFTVDPLGFLTFLRARLAAERYDVLLPLHDEVFLLSRVREELAKLVAVAIPEFSALEVLQSKIRFHALLKELDIPQPEADVVVERQDFDRWNDFPRYLKADYGTAGQAVRLVRDQAELRLALEALRASGWWGEGMPVLMQRPALGHQGFVRAVFRQGQLVAHHATVAERRGVGGAAVAKIGVNHPVVEEHMRRLGERLAWHGVIFCDYFYDDTTRVPLYIEGNPRIGDSANATFSGVNLLQQWVDVAIGRQSSPLKAAPSGVRSHSALLIMLSKALEGASRAELWRELQRRRRGVGIYENSRDELTRPSEDPLSLVPFAWITTRLLIHPASADRVVRGTVAGYALNAEAADRIRGIPQATLASCLNAN